MSWGSLWVYFFQELRALSRWSHLAIQSFVRFYASGLCWMLGVILGALAANSINILTPSGLSQLDSLAGSHRTRGSVPLQVRGVDGQVGVVARPSVPSGVRDARRQVVRRNSRWAKTSQRQVSFMIQCGLDSLFLIGKLTFHLPVGWPTCTLTFLCFSNL